MARRTPLKRQILINSSPFEKRIAILENNHLADIFYEQQENTVQVGNIYKGVVNAVLPGLQAAFVDLGTDKAGFLHVEDVIDREKRLKREYDDDNALIKNQPMESIDSLLKVGQELIVQVTKEPISTKGPKLTTHITLAGRFLVCMPNTSFVGVSKKSRDLGRRRELKRMVQRLKGKDIGYIVRTLGLGESEEEFTKQINILEGKWDYCREKIETAEPRSLVYQESDLLEVTMRDYFSENVEEVIVDSKEEYNTIVNYLNLLSPDMAKRVKLFKETAPLFDHYGLEDELDKTFEAKVFLRRGGYLIIDQAEALVAIDVNTGSKVKGKDQAKNIVETNVDAAWEIAKQMRLRDLGGLVVIDFIDMESEEDIEQVENEFKKAIRQDKAPINFSLISQFGLMELTRKRVKANLVNSFSNICPTCHGNRYISTTETVLATIDRWLRRCKSKGRYKSISLALHPDLLDIILENRAQIVKHWETKYKLKLELLEHNLPNFHEYRMFEADSDKEITHKFKNTYSDQENHSST